MVSLFRLGRVPRPTSQHTRPKVLSGCPVLARFWLGRDKFQDRIRCRPRGTRSRINRLPTVETVGYHLSRPRRSGCAGLVPQAEFRIARQNELQPQPGNNFLQRTHSISRPTRNRQSASPALRDERPLNPRIVGDDVVCDPANNRLVGRSVLSEKSVLGIGNGIHRGTPPRRGASLRDNSSRWPSETLTFHAQ